MSETLKQLLAEKGFKETLELPPNFSFGHVKTIIDFGYGSGHGNNPAELQESIKILAGEIIGVSGDEKMVGWLRKVRGVKKNVKQLYNLLAGYGYKITKLKESALVTEHKETGISVWLRYNYAIEGTESTFHNEHLVKLNPLDAQKIINKILKEQDCAANFVGEKLVFMDKRLPRSIGREESKNKLLPRSVNASVVDEEIKRTLPKKPAE